MYIMITEITILNENIIRKDIYRIKSLELTRLSPCNFVYNWLSTAVYRQLFICCLFKARIEDHSCTQTTLGVSGCRAK